MKTCEQYQELVSAYVDGETSDEETSEIFFHLGTCRECRTFLTSVLDLQYALITDDAAVHGSVARTDIAARHAEHAAAGDRAPMWKRKFSMSYAAAAAAIAVMIFSAGLLTLRIQQPSPPVNQTQTEYVYLTSYPTVNVVASPLPPQKSN